MATQEHQLHELERLLAVSIGPACHELRSPLAVVYGFARMLEQDARSTGSHLERIIEGSSRLDDLLDVLALMGRIAAGRTRPEVRDYPVDAVLADMAVQPGHDLPMSIGATCDQLVHVDREWLRAAVADAVHGLCYDPSMRVIVTPRAHAGNVRIELSVDGAMPLPEREAGSCSLRIALAHMRVVAIGGVMHPSDFGLVIEVPSRSVA
jgi:signal transduction histidine kinase